MLLTPDANESRFSVKYSFDAFSNSIFSMGPMLREVGARHGPTRDFSKYVKSELIVNGPQHPIGEYLTDSDLGRDQRRALIDVVTKAPEELSKAVSGLTDAMLDTGRDDRRTVWTIVFPSGVERDDFIDRCTQHVRLAWPASYGTNSVVSQTQRLELKCKSCVGRVGRGQVGGGKLDSPRAYPKIA
jgi:hypothetical protein